MPHNTTATQHTDVWFKYGAGCEQQLLQLPTALLPWTVQVHPSQRRSLCKAGHTTYNTHYYQDNTHYIQHTLLSGECILPEPAAASVPSTKYLVQSDIRRAISGSSGFAKRRDERPVTSLLYASADVAAGIWILRARAPDLEHW